MILSFHLRNDQVVEIVFCGSFPYAFTVSSVCTAPDFTAGQFYIFPVQCISYILNGEPVSSQFYRVKPDAHGKSLTENIYGTYAVNGLKPFLYHVFRDSL